MQMTGVPGADVRQRMKKRELPATARPVGGQLGLNFVLLVR